MVASSSRIPGLARRRVATAAVLMALVVAAFEGTVVTSAMPTIVRDLGGMGAYAWVFSAFLVASTLAVLVCGKLADAFGRLPVFAGGMALFLAGSALCGASTSFAALVAFRVVQGLGAGALQPIAMVVGADLYTLEERARVQAVFTGAWGAANVVGPVIGGWIVEHASWRWVFFVNVPVGALAVALLLASYRDPPRARVPGPVGARGALLAGSGTALVALGLEPHGVVSVGWRWVVVAGAAAAVALLLRHERRTSRPLLPRAVLAEPAVQAGLLSGAFVGGILYSCAAYVPLWMVTQSRGDALVAGAALVPLLAGWAIGSSFGVRVLVARGMKASVGGGFAIAATGAASLAVVVARGLPTGWALASLGVLGLGLGPAASTSLVAPQSIVGWRHRGAVTSAVYASRMLGGSLAVAALGALSGGARFGAVALLTVLGWLGALGRAPRALDARIETASATAE